MQNMNNLMKRQKPHNNGQNFYLTAFLINLAAGVFSFAWTIIAEGGLFSLAGDFNAQQITFAMAANDAIKSGKVIYDWSLDLGSNFIGGQTFYILGNPSFWLSLLFPSSWFMYVCGWIYVLKYAVAGLTSYAFMRRYIKNQNYAVIASMLYAFSGYMATDLLFYHFHDVVALFPVMMLTFDDLMLKKKRGPFIFAVCINALVNYFFIIGEIIFLVAYYVLRYLVSGSKDGSRQGFKRNFKMNLRKLPQICTEGALGCMIGAVLLVPAYIFTVQNPRVEVDYNGSSAIVYSFERYLYILKGLVFPGEVMSHQSAVIKNNFSSCNAYLPMVGLVLVIAFVMTNKKHWLTNMLKFCLIMALVPILNASFSLFAGVYCRWYYMAVLMMALASGMMLDRWGQDKRDWATPTPSEKAIEKGAVIWGAISAAFILFLVFVPWNDSEPSKIYRQDVFGAWTAVSLAGTFLTWFILCKMKRNRRIAMTISVYAFAILTTATAIFLYQLAHGEDARHIYDRLMTSRKIEYTTPEYRFTNTDNIETLANQYPASANFCSTVSGSIFRFYTSLGLSRDVKSPDAPQGMMNLISAKYTIETQKRDTGEPIQTVAGDQTTYYVYQNNSVPPIGFTYDTYMTESEFEGTNATVRAIVMLKTLVIPDDMEATVSQRLRHYNEATDGKATLEYLNKISSDHLDEASVDVTETTSSYCSTITCNTDKYAFFSIPNDSGWTATVNGEQVDIMDINGFMAVPVSAGTNRIEFHYKVPGLTAGFLITGGALFLTALYLFIFSTGKGRKKKSPAEYSREIPVRADLQSDPAGTADNMNITDAAETADTMNITDALGTTDTVGTVPRSAN